MNSNQSKVDQEYNVPRPRRIYLLIVIVALVILGTMAYTLFTGNRISAKYAPLVDATMEIRFQGTQAHLWFEEAISGDPHKKIEEVLDFIDQADWYAQAILEGGSNPEGTFIPTKDPKIEEPIRVVRKDLAEFKKLTKQRLKIGKAAGIGSDVDQKYDAVFEHFLKQSDSVEKLIQNAMTQDLERFRFSQVILMLACLILSVAVGVLFHRLDRRRADAVVLARKEELRAGQSEKWLSTSLESMGDAVITTDPEGKVTYLNPVAESLTGWNRSDAKGVEITDVFNIANEETRKPVENPVSRVLREGIVVGLANHTVLITKDGKHIPIADSGAPIKDDQGHLMGVILVFHDILERKQAEEALRKYARIVATSKDHMALIDRNYIYQTVNAAALKAVKKSHEDIVGHSVAEIFGQEYFEKHQKPNIDRCLAGETVRYQTWINYPAYGRRYMEIDYSPYVEADESISGYVVNSRDITEQKKLEDQLRQAQKMEAIGTLAGGIAHDFNNILAAIMGYTEIALSHVEKENKLYESLQKVFQAGGRATDMVKQILTFSRQAEQERSPVQIKLIVKEALKFLRASLPTTIEVRQNIWSDALVLADPTQIHQILMNLCTNAEHAMREKGGVLVVKLADVELDADFTAAHPDMKPGAYLNLTVSDTGCGMPGHVIDRIFDPFFTTKEKSEGTGMGLSVVHGIVRSFGGAITAYSEPGRGSTFTVYFPVIEKRLEPQVPAEAEEAIPTGSESILFVDDEPALANIGKQTLESLGYEVTFRISSIEALELFKAQPDRFDLVITDTTMPHMTGETLAQELIRIRPEIPVILCTGYSARVNEQQAMTMGIRAFVMKPVVKREIAKTVRKVIDGK